MEFIIKYWELLIVAVAVLACAVIAVMKFISGNKSQQLAKVKEWLLYATTLAEKELGGGTGKLKLRYVFDMFAARFPWMAKVISFEVFCKLVDEALDGMNTMLTSNRAVQLYVNGLSTMEDTEADG